MSGAAAKSAWTIGAGGASMVMDCDSKRSCSPDRTTVGEVIVRASASPKAIEPDPSMLPARMRIQAKVSSPPLPIARPMPEDNTDDPVRSLISPAVLLSDPSRKTGKCSLSTRSGEKSSAMTSTKPASHRTSTDAVRRPSKYGWNSWAEIRKKNVDPGATVASAISAPGVPASS